MRIIELKLFHHYTSVTSLMMPRYGHTTLDQLFRMHIPQLCFSYNALLSSILGLAAVDFLCLDPHNHDMKRAARFYLNETTTQQAQLVSNVNKENAESVTLVSMFLSMQIRLRASFIGEDELYKLPIEWFHLNYGTIMLYHMCIPHLRSSNVLTVLGIRPAKLIVGSSAKDFLPSLIWKDSISLRDGFKAKDIDRKTKLVYECTLSYIEEIYIALLKAEEPEWTRRRHFGMPAVVPRGFVKLLEQQDPRAMAILARYMALMKMCDGPWYCPGAAEFEVHGIMSLMPRNWLWAMDWPLQILKLNKLADCEIQNSEPEPERTDNPWLGVLDIDLHDDLHLEVPLNRDRPSSGTIILPSSSYPLSPRISDSFGGSIRSGISTSVLRCLGMRPVEEAKLVLEDDEILAGIALRNHITSNEME